MATTQTLAIAPEVPHGADFKARAREYLDDERYHRSFTFPVSSASGLTSDFTITYCDYGSQETEDGREPSVLLICGPLLGSRYLYVAKDKLAKEHGVRIIHPDRPGFGGTTEVDVQDRIKAWLDLVPALLSHLNIKHVSLICHSAGTIYAMNTLLHLKHILHPTKPYIAICAPWIHPSRSGATTMTMTNMLCPDAVLSRLDRVASFLNTTLMPISGPSSTLLGALTTAKPRASADVEFEEALRPLLVERAYAESVHGLGQDAMLLMKRSGSGSEWGTWGDYDMFVPLFATTRESGGPEPLPKLRVEVFFAETDIMIGTEVTKWFDGCWTGEQAGETIDYSSHVIAGSDHDSVTDMRYGVIERIFTAISASKVAIPSAPPS